MEQYVILFGAADCHKTIFYQEYLKKRGVAFDFRDVRQDEHAAETLRSLYESGQLNFPTFLIGGKKLRNPTVKQLDKWLVKKDSLGEKSPSN